VKTIATIAIVAIASMCWAIATFPAGLAYFLATRGRS
jgi:hypothetical protein